MSTYKRLLAYLRPYGGKLALAIVSMVILAATTGLYPLALDLLTTYLVDGSSSIGRVVDPALAKLSRTAGYAGVAIDEAALRALIEANLLVLFAAVVAIKAASQAIRFYTMGMIAQWVTRDLRRDLFRAIVGQNAGFFSDQATGFLVSRVVNDVSQVERAATYAVPILVGDVLKVVVLAAVCVASYPKLSLVALVVAPLAIFPVVRFGRMLKRYAKRSQEELGGISNRVAETVGGIRVVQAYGGESHELARFGAAADTYLVTMRKSVLVRALQTPAMEMVGVLALLMTITYAVSQAKSGAIRPGEVVGIMLALVLLYEPLKAIGRLNSMVLPGVASAERIFELVDRKPELTGGTRTLEAAPNKVRFENVSFRYRAEGELVLDRFELELDKGKIVALAGPSGGGKSTVASLLLRFFDPTAGKITFDGTDIREYTLESLRAQIALVAQETYLFNDTVRANIAYGRRDATPEMVEDAAKRAFAHDFIRALPQGYDTITGERGIQLSGGQRQRIAIARAFLAGAPILILDEATSALDTESEREVQAAIDALMVDRTVLVIAHRLSTIRRADEIVILDRGRVVERGTHDALIALESAYARLVRANEGRP